MVFLNALCSNSIETLEAEFSMNISACLMMMMMGREQGGIFLPIYTMQQQCLSFCKWPVIVISVYSFFVILGSLLNANELVNGLRLSCVIKKRTTRTNAVVRIFVFEWIFLSQSICYVCTVYCLLHFKRFLSF